MISTAQYTAKGRSNFFIVLPIILVFCLIVNSAIAQQAKAKDPYPKPIKLTAAQLAKFVGKYRNMDDYVTITALNGGLVLKQLQEPHETINFYPTDLREFNTRHFWKPYWIIFGGKPNSIAPGFVTTGHDIWVRVK